MSAANFLLLLVRSSVVLAFAGLVMVAARRNPVLRVAAARWGLVGALLVAFSVIPFAERPRPVVSVVGTLPSFTLPVIAQSVPVAVLKPKVAAPAPRVAPATFEIQRWILPVWAGGALSLLVQLGFGVFVLRRARYSCRPASDVLMNKVAALAAEVGLGTPKVLEGERISGPCVAGILRPMVMLPLGWNERTETDVVDAVLCHELAHLANGDLRWGLFARIARILLWPQPLVWLLIRPAATAEEEACDRAVLASGVSQARYAAGLLELREGRATRVPSLAIGAVSRRSGFGRRIESILAFRGVGGARLSRWAGIAVRVGALALALGATFVFARPRGQAPDSMAGWVKGPKAGPIVLVNDDGKPVQDAQAWLIVAGESPMPEVLRPKVKGSMIRIEDGPSPADSSGLLAVRAPGYGLTLIRLWPVKNRIAEIRVFPAVSLQGSLLLPAGVSAAGLPLDIPLLVRPGRDSAGPVFLQAKSIPGLMPTAMTDAKGAFRFDGLPPETRVQVEVDDDRFAKGGLGDRIATGKAGETAAMLLKVRLAGRIVGRVTQDGKPVAGVKVAAQTNTDRGSYDLGDWGEAISGPDGRYAIERLGATVYNVATDLSNGLDRAVTAKAHEALSVEAGKTIEKVDFDLTPGSVVEGTASLPNGKPLAKTLVAVYGPAHPESSAWVQFTKTDAAGRYRLRVPPGQQRIYLMDQRYEMAHQRVATMDGAILHLDLHVTGLKEEEPALAIEETVDSGTPAKPVEDIQTGPRASFGPGKPFYGPVRLSNGATVRLAFVQDGTKGNPLWNPDGGPATVADRARAIDMAGFGEGKASRSLYLRVDVEGFDRRDLSAIVQPAHPSSWSPWQTYGDGHGASMDLASFRANRKLRVTDMRFGLAAGPYKTEYTGRMGEGPMRPQTTHNRTAPPGATVAIAVHFPRALTQKDLRLEAIAKDGRHLPLVFSQEGSPRKGETDMTRTFGFSGGTAADIDHVELQSREYAWATFRGIQLYPRS